jgi:4-hydroxyphenylacetate 3-hydroxylase-like protein
MLISGKEKLERMRDGRVIYIGAERVDDVTRHPAFRNAARTIADLYDFKADADRRDLFSFEENGECYGLPWLRCHTREDLVRRMRAMKATADATYGLIGRSPDHVAGLITGLAMKPALLDELTPGFGGNLIRYYEHAQERSLRFVRGDAALRYPQPGNLRRGGARRPDPSGRRRRRRRRHHLRHEDAGDRRGLRRRGVDRQSHAYRRQAGGREHHLRAAGQHARRLVLGARTLRASRPSRSRLSAQLPLRRNRHGVGVRPRQGPLGARLPTQQRGNVAPHLYRDAGELLPEPSVQRALLEQDGIDRRAREPHVPGERRRQDSGGARNVGTARRPRGDGRRARERADRGLRAMARQLRHAQPADHVRHAQLVPGAPY